MPRAMQRKSDLLKRQRNKSWRSGRAYVSFRTLGNHSGILRSLGFFHYHFSVFDLFFAVATARKASGDEKRIAVALPLKVERN